MALSVSPVVQLYDQERGGCVRLTNDEIHVIAPDFAKPPPLIAATIRAGNHIRQPNFAEDAIPPLDGLIQRIPQRTLSLREQV
jgi:hypothetical protein